MSEQVTLRFNNGSGTYTLADDPEMLAQLAPAILSHLGCSFQISWPNRSPEEKDAARKHNRAQRQQEAEMYASHVDPLFLHGEDRDAVRDLLAEAFKAGWDAAPKPVGYLR